MRPAAAATLLTALAAGANARRDSSFPRTLVNGSLVAAVFTPMTSGGSVDVSKVPAQATYLCESGVKWAFVSGTTGESLSLSVEERMSLAEAWVKAAASSCIQVIVHVGHNSLPSAQQLAAHAEKIGAHAVAAMSPCFFVPASIDALVQWLAQVAASAPSLPFYYYHIPSMTHADFKMAQLLPAAAAKIPTLNGIKFTDYDLSDFSLAAAFASPATGRRFEMLFGRDEVMEGARLFGASGFVGSTYNFAGRLYNRILDDFARGNFTGALVEQRRAQDMISIMVGYSAGGENAGKAINEMRTGIKMGPPRLPFLPADPSPIHDALQKIGFFDWS